MSDWPFLVPDNGLATDRAKFINSFICPRISLRLPVPSSFLVFIFLLEEMKKDPAKTKLFYLSEKHSADFKQ